MTDIINSLSAQVNPGIPADLRTGDTVRVHARIVEGDRERVQVFQGVVMRLRKTGVNGSFTVRRIASHGIGVERTFSLASPRIDRVEIVRRAKVRRAQLYFLRKYRGKAARLKEDRSRFERNKNGSQA
ncbi:MAG TPA: 50S ribosomal protein L19 [Chloroflexi bacterium]|jgi:large subunit ribosomal protein L19|nr:50S ribosomal protein L19 [Chloroflexota bacterium]